VRVFKTKWFDRFARKERITDAALCDAVDRAVKGTIDADLGGGVIKQRVARGGQGRSGGFRRLAGHYLGARDAEFAKLVKVDALTEVLCDGDEKVS
jgi:hypothetical protein